MLLISTASAGRSPGRRRLYAVGLGLFAASAAGALAPDVGSLIAARRAGRRGGVMPLGLALLSAAFPAREARCGDRHLDAITGLAIASGPLMESAVVEGLDWQWIFWINVPIGLAFIPRADQDERELRARHRP